MIKELEERYIKNIAEAQVAAWQEAFKGILSEAVLSGLDFKAFERNWRKIITQKERKNFIWVNEKNKGVGFISFGVPKDKEELAEMEIYGIYVHPTFWGKGIGFQLMNYAIDRIKHENSSGRIILWTMTANILSQQFYRQVGFSTNGKTRMSARKNESFEEIQFEIG